MVAGLEFVDTPLQISSPSTYFFIETSYLHRLTGSSQGEFRDRGSKFYAYAWPVDSLEEVEACLTATRKKYHDARHVCYAYRLGIRGETVFAQDDGEPSHSAGDPILGAIRSAELTWTLVAVVRYFGGTKLGIRGLIEAYRTAAEAAIQANQKEALIPRVQFSLTYGYPQTSHINKLLHPFPVEIIESRFTESCYQRFQIEASQFPPLEQSFQQQGISLDEIEKD